jgi:hypothetical protein
MNNALLKNMKNLFILLNHKLNESQRQNAIKNGIENFIVLPPDLQEIWQGIPPMQEKLVPVLAPVRQWISEKASPGDFVLVQGDFGATYLMVNFAFEKGLVPVYATTKRNAVERHLDDGTIKMEHIFSFCMFRKYGQ